MKKNYFTATGLMMAIALASGFSACSNENGDDGTDIIKKGEPITIKAQIDASADTRTTVTPGADGTAAVKWAAQDAFELFGDADHHTFTLAAGGEDKNSADFTGTAVGLSSTYNAFYPAIKAKKADGQTAADHFNEIVLSVAGQAQAGDDAANHLGAYSYMTASKSAQDNFSFTHLMMMLSLNITLPEAATPTSLVISTPDGNLLYSGMNGDGTGKVAVNEQILALSGITSVTSFKAHLMMIPFALANQKMVITVNCEGGKKYAVTKENVTMNYQVGLRYTASVTLVASTSSSVFDDTVIASQGEDFSSGSGTALDPYIISNAMQLQKMTMTFARGVYYKLDTDINVTASGWGPIGDSGTPFSGHFDGNNHKITGSLSGNSNRTAGFFGQVAGATIKNLKIEANVTNTASNRGNTGGIAGFCATPKSVITNCTVTGSIVGVNADYCYTGGIVGNAAYGEVVNCHFSGSSITGTILGGLVGYSDVDGSAVYDCCTSTYSPLLGTASTGSLKTCNHGSHQ